MVDEHLEVTGIRGDDLSSGSHVHDMRVNHLGGSGSAEQTADGVSLISAEGHDRATTQEHSQSCLASSTAHLGDDWCGRHRSHAQG